MTQEQPLRPYRVLEIGSGAAALCGRALADLGAEVVKVEPPAGDPMRRQAPLAGDTGIAFLWYNAGKRGVTLDLEQPEEQQRLRRALADFDVLIDGAPPGWLAAHGLSPDELRRRYPHLVITSVTPFGQTGPYRDWQGSSLVAWALAGSLIRCGLPDAPPVGPPTQLSYVIAGLTAASAAVVALWERGRTGRGDWIDCSVLEAVQAQADWSAPIYSATGTTAKRAGAGPLFRIYKTGDGWVRVINLSVKQWQAFRHWLGDPPEIAGPEWANPLYRGANRAVLDDLCERAFAGRSKVELFRDGQRAGVGIVPIYSPAEVMEDEHFVARGTFVDFPLPDGRTARAPGGFVRMASARPVPPRPAPALGAGPEALAGTRAPLAPRGGGGLPLAGIRVVELGSGAVAPEVTRILGEFGADVIKIESRTQIDFMRLQGSNIEASVGWSSSNRNKRSVLVDLKHPEGRRIGHALFERADVVVENNTGGVMARLGVDYPTLARHNPRLVYLSSQAFGASGPCTAYGGFGPTNAAVSGLSFLWNAPDAPQPEGVQVIFPDHILGRIGCMAVVAALDESERTGRGQHIDMAQTEAAIAAIAEAFIESDLTGRTVPARGNRSPIGAPHGVFPALGDDAWIAITVESDEQWARLRDVVGIAEWRDRRYDTAAGRLADRDVIEAQLAAWTAQFTPVALMRRLQEAGVPAGAAYTTPQVMADVHFTERGFFRTVNHPVLGAVRMEGVPFQAERLRWDAARPAPLFGEHTDAVLREWLGMTAEEIAAAREAGALA
jgi:crotonobetainyl-CoA:carnitine CoA-transferase CaiB-like acyl-CoA transferase